MSRSHRKHRYIGICVCDSEKDDKREANRRYRHAVRQRLQTGVPTNATTAADDATDALTLPHWREYSDPWTWGKDGKWFIPATYPRASELLRK